MQETLYIAFQNDGGGCSLPTDNLERLVERWGLWYGGWPTEFCRLSEGSEEEEEKEGPLESPLVGVCKEHLEEAVRQWTARWAGEWSGEMTREQLNWRHVLGRTTQDKAGVKSGLENALLARGLHCWKLQEFAHPYELENAFLRGVMKRESITLPEAMALIEEFPDVSRLVAARSGPATLGEEVAEAWEVPLGTELRVLYGIGREVTGYFWDAWNPAGGLLVCFETLRGRIRGDDKALTSGVTEAYAAGLWEALPVGDCTLGWVMYSGREEVGKMKGQDDE